jgi:tRNA uridine 5-carboxymethylaminomethyl modification enzyme
MKNKIFDIIVVGGGHAGIEAAWASSSFPKISVALITLESVPIGAAPCNPSIGGVGKGQVVRELDVLGGVMGKLADLAGIQYRTLNESKGPAVFSTRVQIDKERYPEYATSLLESRGNLSIIRDQIISLSELDHNDEKLIQVSSSSNSYQCRKIIFTLGTFLNGLLHLGLDKTEGGRVDCANTQIDFFTDLKELFVNRFKTGTPARINKHSINYTNLEVQPSDSKVSNFHLLHDDFDRNLDQVDCYIAHTNENTISTINENKEKSPMYNGQIQGTGARYCPSIEDKVFRYPNKHKHHIFVEPEGHSLNTIYPSGISTSLPKETQEEFLRTIEGFEDCEIIKYGYAVEYDVIDTTKLDLTLAWKSNRNIYFAGQINGTSGYEEAGAQGFISGINASLSLIGQEPLILSREDSYIGVLISDLVGNLRDEPYRLFTSRVENRLYIREDNVVQRMANYRLDLGLNDEIDSKIKIFKANIEHFSEIFDSMYVDKQSFEAINNEFFENVPRRTSVSEILRIPMINSVDFLRNFLNDNGIELSYREIATLAYSKKYSGYIKKADVSRSFKEELNNKSIEWKVLMESHNISFECKHRIDQVRPETFGQLKLINGIRPATLIAVASSL